MAFEVAAKFIAFYVDFIEFYRDFALERKTILSKADIHIL